MDDVKNPKHKYHGNPVDYAIDVFSFYMCFKCNVCFIFFVFASIRFINLLCSLHTLEEGDNVEKY